jgi:hypothetical protein
VGRTPTIPQNDAGWRTDPPVSEPRAPRANPAATAAALPPLVPPGTRSMSSGFRVGPLAEFSVEDPIANSSRLVLPIRIAPAASSRSTTVAVNGGAHPSRIRDEQVVGMPRVQRLSLIASGTPASGPASPPRATFASTATAQRNASSRMTWLNAWIATSRSSMRSRHSWTRSTARRVPARTSDAIARSGGLVIALVVARHGTPLFGSASSADACLIGSVHPPSCHSARRGVTWRVGGGHAPHLSGERDRDRAVTSRTA